MDAFAGMTSLAGNGPFQIVQAGATFADMAIDWTACTAIETVPGKLSGSPVVRGTRVRPEDLVVNRDGARTG